MRSIEWGSSKKRDPTEGNFFTGQKPGAVQQFGATSVCENPLVGAQTLRSGLGRGCACCKSSGPCTFGLVQSSEGSPNGSFFHPPLKGGCAVSCERFGKCPPADILVRGDFSTVWSRTKACFSSF